MGANELNINLCDEVLLVTKVIIWKQMKYVPVFSRFTRSEAKDEFW